MKQMTPRTDHEAYRADFSGEMVTGADFAAQLELELNEAKAALEREQQDCAALRQMVRELQSKLSNEERNYRHLAQHHNEHCTCMEIY